MDPNKNGQKEKVEALKSLADLGPELYEDISSSTDTSEATEAERAFQNINPYEYHGFYKYMPTEMSDV